MISLANYIKERINITHVIIIWFVVNIVSASITLLYSDEAYYSLFANRLDFGYFDHPPMIALMIRIGSFFFKNELGVRLLSVIDVTLALYFTYKLADVHKPVLYLTAIFSIFGLNILGFLALPDSPLLLFTALFFLVYKKFLVKESLVNSILLGITMAALLFSKYHGILVIFFTVITNLKLLKSGKFWISVSLGFLLYIPHILWQLNHDLVSISYHFLERSASHYHVSYTLEYIIGQILYYGPVSAIFMYMAAFKFKQKNLFDKALTWNLWGFIAFFFLSSFKGRVEVNWTLPIIIPLLIFFLRYPGEKPAYAKMFYILAIPVIIIICILRIEIAYPFFNLGVKRIDEIKEQKEFGKEIIEKSQGLPVITNSYQKAGIVSFYTKTFAPSINVNSRRNQFSIWHADDSLKFKKVAYVNNYLEEGIRIQNPVYKDYKVTIIDSLPVMNDILITTRLNRLRVQHNGIVNIKVILLAKKEPENYRDAGNYSTRLNACLFKKDKLMIEEDCLLPVDLLLKNNKGEYNFQFIAPAEIGKYQVVVSLKTSELGTWSTKKTVNLTVR
jgi:hypothetical protein